MAGQSLGLFKKKKFFLRFSNIFFQKKFFGFELELERKNYDVTPMTSESYDVRGYDVRGYDVRGYDVPGP